jgi:hypothetical protein
MRARTALLLLFLFSAAHGQRKGSPPPTRPAPIAIASSSQIVVDGGDIHNETFPLTRAEGDWFVTANDAHAALTLKTVPPKPPVTLHISWFGKQASHVINEENNTDQTGDHVTFALYMNGGAPYNLAAKPGGDQAVTVTVTRMDDHDLEARISGAANALRINGAVSLHRDALPARPATGSYGACDNVIYDKMYGAQSRSPSECEVRLDSDVRRAIHQSLQKVMSHFRSNGWIVEEEPGLKPITSNARGSEKNPFRIDFTSSGSYRVLLKMDPATAQYQAHAKKIEQLMEKMRNDATRAAAFEEFQRAAYEAKNATEVKIDVTINMLSAGIANFRSEHTVLNLPGASYAVFSAHSQAPTGGGIENSQDRAIALVGAWSPAAIEKHSDGGERIDVKAAFDKSAPLLAVQNVLIRVEANSELAQSVLRQVDFAPLAALLRH